MRKRRASSAALALIDQAPTAQPTADDSPAIARKPVPIVTVRAEADEDGKLSLLVQQGPGALEAVFGSRCEEDGKRQPFSEQAVSDLVQIALGGEKAPLPQGPVNMQAVNAMIEGVAAFEATNELEGMIALQAVAFHRLTMDRLARAVRQPGNEAHINQANKCSRTFATLVEAMNRCRGKTTTQKFVFEQVTVQPGAQAVVGGVTQGGGGRLETMGSSPCR